jgi:uncharacterized protein (DUF934 family)
MPLVKNGVLATDEYTAITDDGAIPEGVPVLLEASRFLESSAELARRNAPVGVVWPNDRRVSELAPHLGRLALIALVFPKFRDGRAYSQARQLREHYGFKGELRATGDVLRDQFLFMLRAGFDSFAVKKETDASAFADAISRYSVVYQPGGNGRTIASAARLAPRAPQ